MNDNIIRINGKLAIKTNNPFEVDVSKPTDDSFEKFDDYKYL